MSYISYTNNGHAVVSVWYLSTRRLCVLFNRCFDKLLVSWPNIGSGSTISGRMVTIAYRAVFMYINSGMIRKCNRLEEKWKITVIDDSLNRYLSRHQLSYSLFLMYNRWYALDLIDTLSDDALFELLFSYIWHVTPYKYILSSLRTFKKISPNSKPSSVNSVAANNCCVKIIGNVSPGKINESWKNIGKR